MFPAGTQLAATTGFFGIAGTQPCSLTLQLPKSDPAVPPRNKWEANGAAETLRDTLVSHPSPENSWMDQSQPSEEDLPSGIWVKTKAASCPAGDEDSQGEQGSLPARDNLPHP